MGPHLLGLPDELLVLILVFLPLNSITACKRSCWRLRAVIRQSGRLRCRIRTMKNFMEDLSPPGLSTSDFLDNLRKWERAWLTLNIKKGAASHTMFRPFDVQCDFLLQSGYLIQRALREKASDSEWTDVPLEAEATTGGWALDVDQDLVAVSLLSRRKRLEIRLLRFTTGTIHDSAVIPVIQLEFEGKYDRSFGTHIEIMGGHLVVLFAHGSLLRSYQSIYVVDWIQGLILYTQASSCPPKDPNQSYEFQQDILVHCSSIYFEAPIGPPVQKLACRIRLVLLCERATQRAVLLGKQNIFFLRPSNQPSHLGRRGRRAKPWKVG
ncbi:hypothetical protein BC827DRAFT_522842 [Russula dissimulans]|nr:hypothetical protein BC827DRAFT_522842 [Russula dissimulans]